MQLVIGCRFRYSFWIGRQHKMNTPLLKLVDGLAAVRQLHPLYKSPNHITGRSLLRRMCLHDLQQQWNTFKASYIDVCERAGWCRALTLAEVNRCEASAAAFR